MSEYGDMTMSEYRDALASNDPTPGGGTAAAVALTQGAALAVMVCKLTEENDKWKNGWNAAEICRNIATPLLNLGYILASDDAKSFDSVMAAYKLPKNTDDEIAARKSAIHQGTFEAAMVPLDTAKNAFKLLESLPELARVGNANAVTDVGVAGLLVSAACKGALFNVEINIDSLPEHMVEDLRIELDMLRGRSREISRELMNAVNDRMHS